MNPSTKDLLDAVGAVNADAVIILPNNKNIIMAAQSACDLSDTPCAVVPTKSVPEAFAALFGFDEGAGLEEKRRVDDRGVRGGENNRYTYRIRRTPHDNPIKEGDVIGIADGSIEAVGSSVDDVVLSASGRDGGEEADTLTILAGEDLSDGAFEGLVERIEGAFGELEVDAHRGDQPLYPVVMSVE